MKSTKLSIRDFPLYGFQPARSVFQQNPEQKSAPVEAPKKPETTPPAADKKPEEVTIADLEVERQNAVKTIQEKIRHPDIQKKALDNLSNKIIPLQMRVFNLETARQTTKDQIKSEMSRLTQEVLAQQDVLNFQDIKVGSVTFIYEPPMARENYTKEFEKAVNSLKTAEAYKTMGKDVASFTSTLYNYRNGDVLITLGKDDPADSKKENKIIRQVKVSGNSITEENTDTKKEQTINDAQSFTNAFNAWKDQGKDQSKQVLFTFGEPPKSFPPEGVKLDESLELMGIKKEDLTIEMLQHMGGSGVGALDVSRNTLTTTIEWRDGKPVPVGTREEHKRVLSGKGDAVEKDNEGRVLREEKTDETVVNRQKRMSTTVTEYYPQPSGSPLHIKRQEVYKDGIISSVTDYDKKGQMVKRETFVKDSEGVKAVDTPTGKMIAEVDEDGNPVKDVYGEVKLVPEVKRAMEFTDANGNKVVIRSLSEANVERKKAGKPPMSPEDYMQFLANSLQSDQQKNAFANLMMHYRADERGTDTWQTGEQTVQREYNGLFIGDCEDQAHFWASVNKLQGRQSYVLGLPEHAEDITFFRNPNNTISVMRAGTFGIKREPGEFKTAEEALTYLTNNVYKSSVSHVEALGDGRFFRPPKRGETPKVTVLILDPAKTEETDRQKTKDTPTTDLVVNPTDKPRIS
jgi:hypothetical protein